MTTVPARAGFGHIDVSPIDLEGVRAPDPLYLLQEVLPPDCAVIAVDSPTGR